MLITPDKANSKFYDPWHFDP
jgi:NADH-quinone oxidoreductase chain I